VSIHGVLLAAGAGSRMGMPKALVRDPEGESWLARATAVLLDGGCAAVTVVLGAAADEARHLVPDGVDAVDVVVAEDWETGMAASLRGGLAAADRTSATAALIHLVDLPDVTAEVVRRVLAHGGHPGELARATYDRRPGHPVLIGRDHWPQLVAAVTGDEGARTYLADHATILVECGDLASGQDVDAR